MPIQATCKGRTRPDFLYVSPELADLLFDVDVIQDVWPDHAVLMGRFRKLSKCSVLVGVACSRATSVASQF